MPFSMWRNHWHFSSPLFMQRKIVYVFDPKAMHTIAVKEQYVYDEARWFLG